MVYLNTYTQSQRTVYQTIIYSYTAMYVASKLALEILVAAGENVECAIIKDMREMYLHAAELASYCVS